MFRIRKPDVTSAGWPSVTVILPVRNGALTIGQAIESVLSQGYAALQLLVVDDGSDDATLKVLSGYGDRLTVLTGAGRGPAAARNLALTHAAGQLVAFIDADDVWWPGKLQAQARFMAAHPDVDVTFGRFVRWTPMGEEATESVSEPPLPTREAYASATRSCSNSLSGLPEATLLSGCLYVDLLLDSVVHIITAMVRREVFEVNGGFDETLPRGSDYEFWLRVSRPCTMVQLDLVMASYRVHSASLTKQPWADNGEYTVLRRVIKDHGFQGPDGRQVSATQMNARLSAIAFGHGYLLFWSGQVQASRGWFAKAMGATSGFGWRACAYWGLSWLAPIVKHRLSPGTRQVRTQRHS